MLSVSIPVIRTLLRNGVLDFAVILGDTRWGVSPLYAVSLGFWTLLDSHRSCLVENFGVEPSERYSGFLKGDK